jgi:plasmid stability protein
MATIQVRDIPDETYAWLREQARAAGQSLQAYMRDRVVELAHTRARRAAVLAELDEVLANEPGTGATRDDVLAILDEDRRR